MAKLLGSYSLKADDLDSSIQECLSIPGKEVRITRFAEDFYLDLEMAYPFKRSLARDGFLALHCMRQVLDKVQIAEKTGIYSAALNGPLLYSAIRDYTQDSLVSEIKNLKMKYPPKQHFRQNAPLRATHYSMFLNKKGPLISMVDPVNGFIDALNWAEIDLYDGTVENAIVLSGFTLEDPQLLDWYSRESDHLKESAVCLVLSKDSSLTQHSNLKAGKSLEYGQCSGYFHSGLIFSK